MGTRIKEIYDSIKNTNTYIADSSIKTLTAVAFHEVEQGLNKQFSAEEINNIIEQIGVDYFDFSAKTFDIDNFKNFEKTIERLNNESEYKTFVDNTKNRIKQIIEEK
jgi:hypothetical protein